MAGMDPQEQTFTAKSGRRYKFVSPLGAVSVRVLDGGGVESTMSDGRIVFTQAELIAPPAPQRPEGLQLDLLTAIQRIEAAGRYYQTGTPHGADMAAYLVRQRLVALDVARLRRYLDPATTQYEAVSLPLDDALDALDNNRPLSDEDIDDLRKSVAAIRRFASRMPLGARWTRAASDELKDLLP